MVKKLISASFLQIHETIESINQLKIQRDFMLSFSKDPKGYIQDLLRSQSRDLKVGGSGRLRLQSRDGTTRAAAWRCGLTFSLWGWAASPETPFSSSFALGAA